MALLAAALALFSALNVRAWQVVGVDQRTARAFRPALAEPADRAEVASRLRVLRRQAQRGDVPLARYERVRRALGREGPPLTRPEIDAIFAPDAAGQP